jgi:hypothetical protein
MKKVIKSVNEKLGVIQVTTTDERWYAIQSENPITGLPEYRYIPSVTWICGHYPKGVGFYKWLADKGWDEAEAAKQAAGDKGSRVHKAIESLIDGEEITYETVFTNRNGEEAELAVDEWDAITSFAEWCKDVKPKFLFSEITVISKEYGFAGTVDAIAKIDGQMYILDWKTSQSVWPEYELQLSAYKQALKEMGKDVNGAKLAILQVGYRKNRKRYKFNEIQEKFPLFLSARSIWENESAKQKPAQKDYPLRIKL